MAYRWTEGKNERFLDLAAELVGLKVDVIVTWGTPAAKAAQHATSTIPIVMAAIADPVGSGLVASLAQPEETITGLSAHHPELEGKRFELLKEALPTLTGVALLWNPDHPTPWWSKKRSTRRGTGAWRATPAGGGSKRHPLGGDV